MQRRSLFERMSSLARAETRQPTPDPRGDSRSDQVRRGVTTKADKQL